MDKFIDLHLHLDGAITVDIAKKLAELQKIELPAESDEELKQLLTVPEDCKNLGDFLQCFALPCSLMQTKKGLSEAAFLVCEDLRKQGVVYAEIRFAPQLHLSQELTQEDVILAVLEGMKRSELNANLILCCMRTDDEEANEETVKMARKFLVKDSGVVALDLAGGEQEADFEDYAYLFDQAKELGVPFTVHAGEAAGPENIRRAIECGAKRIGHGVRALEDAELMQQLADEDVYLEMCPTSNKLTQIYPDLSKYPLMEFLNAGIGVCLNTDDPAIEGTTIAQEYKLMEDILGLTELQEKVLIANAIDAAFTSDETKDDLRAQFGL